MEVARAQRGALRPGGRPGPEPARGGRRGSTVVLEVSGGPGTVRVPTVRGLPQAAAIKALGDRDLKATVDARPSESIDKGLAIRTVPEAGEQVDRGERAALRELGTEQIEVPSVTGLSRDSAEDRLRDVGPEPAVEESESKEPEDQVHLPEPDGRDRSTAATRLRSLSPPESPRRPCRTGRPRPGRCLPPAVGPAARAGATGDRRDRSQPGRQGGRPVPAGGDDARGGSRGRDHDRRPHLRRRRHAGRPGNRAVRVAVLGGGRSSEHDVSLDSAGSVRAGCRGRARAARGAHRARRTLDARRRPGGAGALGVGCSARTRPRAARPLRRGRHRAGAARPARRAYVGAGVLASSLSMDKALFKDLMAAHAIPQVDYAVVREGEGSQPARPARVRQARPPGLVGGDPEGDQRGGA